MRTLETIFLKSYNVIIAIFLTLFGYACSKSPINPIDIKTEYGTPTAKFIVQGRVVSVLNNQAIDKIQVVMNVDTVLTDQNGNYQVAVSGFPTDQTYKVQINDIDSTSNGLFENLDTIVEFKNPKFTNGNGHWYNGETEKDLNIKLNPKK